MLVCDVVIRVVEEIDYRRRIWFSKWMSKEKCRMGAMYDDDGIL